MTAYNLAEIRSTSSPPKRGRTPVLVAKAREKLGRFNKAAALEALFRTALQAPADWPANRRASRHVLWMLMRQLIQYTNQKLHLAWLSHERLLQELPLRSKATILYGLRALEAIGAIKRFQRDGCTTVYQVLLGQPEHVLEQVSNNVFALQKTADNDEETLAAVLPLEPGAVARKGSAGELTHSPEEGAKNASARATAPKGAERTRSSAASEPSPQAAPAAPAPPRTPPENIGQWTAVRNAYGAALAKHYPGQKMGSTPKSATRQQIIALVQSVSEKHQLAFEQAAKVAMEQFMRCGSLYRDGGLERHCHPLPWVPQYADKVRAKCTALYRRAQERRHDAETARHELSSDEYKAMTAANVVNIFKTLAPTPPLPPSPSPRKLKPRTSLGGLPPLHDALSGLFQSPAVFGGGADNSQAAEVKAARGRKQQRAYEAKAAQQRQKLALWCREREE